VITDNGRLRELTPTARKELAGIRPARPESLVIDGLGRYRLVTTPGYGGEAIVTGLPAGPVDDTRFAVTGMLTVIGVITLTAAIAAGVLILRRQLAPLSAVAKTAQRIADPELDRGEVTLHKPSTALLRPRPWCSRSA
jgi:two-component system OmpR family sensor kinase